MKTILLLVLAIIAFFNMASCDAKTDYASAKAKLLADQEFQDYLNTYKSPSRPVNISTTGDTLLPGTDMTALELQNIRLSLYKKIHKKYISTNIFTVDQLKGIVSEAATNSTRAHPGQ